MSNTMLGIPVDHPMNVAWDEFRDTEEFSNALRWALKTEYDDARPITFAARIEHVKGALWLAFTKGMEYPNR